MRAILPRRSRRTNENDSVIDIDLRHLRILADFVSGMEWRNLDEVVEAQSGEAG